MRRRRRDPSYLLASPWEGTFRIPGEVVIERRDDERDELWVLSSAPAHCEELLTLDVSGPEDPDGPGGREPPGPGRWWDPAPTSTRDRGVTSTGRRPTVGRQDQRPSESEGATRTERAAEAASE